MLTYEQMSPIRALCLFAARLNHDIDDPTLESAKAELAILAGEAFAYGPRVVHVNDSGAWACMTRGWYRHNTRGGGSVFLFHFGAYGSDHVLAFGTLDDALEDAAETLRKVAPGLFTEPELPDDYESLDEDEQESAYNEATTDLTYTESGYIASWEWTVTEMPDLQAVVRWAYGE